MKELLLSGLLAAMPTAAVSAEVTHHHTIPAVSHSVQVTQDWGVDTYTRQILNDLQSLENLLHSPSVDEASIETQLSQILQDMNQYNQWLDQAVVRHAGIHRLPHVQSGRVNDTSSGISISAGDAQVSRDVVTQATNVIKNISLPVLRNNMNAAPAKPTHVVLFSTPASYGRSLQNSGLPQSEVRAIVQSTGGLTIGSEIWIPLYRVHDTSDLANVLTHELTHAILNQNGIGDTLPTWINEGIAWHNGMEAQSQLNPAKANSEADMYNQQLQKATTSGKLLPLSSDESAILKASYNVEWQDALAVEQLIQQYGETEFSAFLKDVAAEGVDQSFSSHFGISRSTFEQEFMQSLTDQLVNK